MRRNWSCIGVVCSALLLSACSSSNLAFELAPTDVVGTWTAGEPFGTVLTLESDGALTATGWPVPLACDGPAAEDLDSLRDAERRDLSGTWDPSEAQPYHLYFVFDGESCSQSGGIFANVWRDDAGSLDLCFVIPLGELADDLVSDQMFILHKEPYDDGDESETCP